MSISDKYLWFLHVSLEYRMHLPESTTKIQLLKGAG